MGLDIDALEAHTRGEVLRPDDRQYEAVRPTYNALSTGRPAVIFRPVGIPDVVAAVRWAADNGVAIGVRGGGHNVAGYAAPEGALLIDLSTWRGATVDPDARTADALGGSRLMDLDAATAVHDLAAPSGTYVDTGIGGLTLTGGISYLVTSEGFACDALVGAQVVTLAGDVLEVDAEREPELLWGLRGGGGNFGIVTRLRYALADVPRMYGGEIHCRGDLGDVILRAFELDAAAPDELALTLVTGRDPDATPAMTILVAWRGDEQSGAAAVRPLTSHRTVVDADLKRLSWLQLQALNKPAPFGLRRYWKGHLVTSADTTVADALLASIRESPGVSHGLTELIHGKAHRIPAESAAFGGRSAAANVTALGTWSDPVDDDAGTAWSRALAARLEPVSLRGGGYLNYPELDQTEARVAAAFPPETWTRLRRLKRRFDPDNRLRFNANIPPATD